MNSPAGADPITAKAGDVVCRPSGWIDVVKFFLLNFGLLAFSVMPRPGSTPFLTMVTVFTALILPCSHVTMALKVIWLYPNGESDPLKTAQRAGALCMIIPNKDVENYMDIISPKTHQIHGQHPLQNPNLGQTGLRKRLLARLRSLIPFRSLVEGEESPLKGDYKMVVVPSWFTVKPHWKSDFPPEPELACNYSFVKAAAAIGQIIYATIELYQARGRQLERFGYAAYSLTVIPYIVMSLTNLLATACGPQYPTMFIVLYRGDQEPGAEMEEAESIPTEKEQQQRDNLDVESDSAVGGSQQQRPNVGKGVESTTNDSSGIENWQKDLEAKISGSVGEAYGSLKKLVGHPERLAESRAYSDRIRQLPAKDFVFGMVQGLVFLSLISTPFVIIQLLTGFEKGQSTMSQRSWVMSWLVIGSYGGAGFGPSFRLWFPRDISDFRFQVIKLGYTMLLSIGVVGASVVVAKMLLEDQLCTKI